MQNPKMVVETCVSTLEYKSFECKSQYPHLRLFRQTHCWGRFAHSSTSFLCAEDESSVSIIYDIIRLKQHFDQHCILPVSKNFQSWQKKMHCGSTCSKNTKHQTWDQIYQTIYPKTNANGKKKTIFEVHLLLNWDDSQKIDTTNYKTVCQLYFYVF